MRSHCSRWRAKLNMMFSVQTTPWIYHQGSLFVGGLKAFQLPIDVGSVIYDTHSDQAPWKIINCPRWKCYTFLFSFFKCPSSPLDRHVFSKSHRDSRIINKQKPKERFDSATKLSNNFNKKKRAANSLFFWLMKKWKSFNHFRIWINKRCKHISFMYFDFVKRH